MLKPENIKQKLNIIRHVTQKLLTSENLTDISLLWYPSITQHGSMNSKGIDFRRPHTFISPSRRLFTARSLKKHRVSLRLRWPRQSMFWDSWSVCSWLLPVAPGYSRFLLAALGSLWLLLAAADCWYPKSLNDLFYLLFATVPESHALTLAQWRIKKHKSLWTNLGMNSQRRPGAARGSQEQPATASRNLE